jgi:anti-sigma regulatory factor (Ser/Thr protein kinase)
MIAMSASEDSILLRFDSDLTFVDYAVQIIADLLAYHGIPNPTNLLVVSRELMKNAVVHGNGNDTGKPVLLRLLRDGGGAYRVEIEDAGQGFDIAAMAGETTAQPGQPVARGYALISALAQRIELNGRGNRVTVIMEP